MERALQITFHNVAESAALDADIRTRVERLEKFYPRIIGCHVTVEIPHKHKHQGFRYNVRLDIKVPGDEIFLGRDMSEDVYVALRDVFDAAKRKLEDHVERQRGEVKAHAAPMRGTVVRLFADEGYGFIETADGEELYFGADNVASPTFERIKVGDEVHFIEEMASQGPQAKRVTVARHRAS